jgi:predicted transcriptional regulator
MTKKQAEPVALSRRERQIMDVVYRLGRATAADITRDLPEAPTYTTVRGLLRVLVEKGHLQYESDGSRYVYHPSVSRENEGVTVLGHVVRTFFQGSMAQAMAALLDSSESLSEAELARLRRVIERARASE